MKIFTSMVLLIGLPAAVAMAEPDIEVQKSVNNAFPIANEPVEFTVEVGNVGDETAADVIIVDPLPSEMVIPDNDAAFPSMGSYDPVTGEWAVGNLEAGMSAVLGVPAVVIEPQPPACIVNSAVSEHLDDVNDTNNEARAAIHQDGVERCVDLSARFNSETSAAIGVTGFHIFPECGVEERYIGSVEIRNMGPDAARNVVITISQTPLVGAEMRFENATLFTCDSCYAAISVMDSSWQGGCRS